jgi:hypothetical protein
MIKAPSPHNDTTRRYPRTLQEAFPAAPTWGQNVPPLHDKVLYAVGLFTLGFLTALVTCC